MNKTELLKLVSDAYDHACEKHPFFAHRPMCDPGPYYATKYLTKQREKLEFMICKERVEGTDVLMCEIAESIEAYSRKDYAHCLHELAQCAAVILRMMEKVEEESKA